MYSLNLSSYGIIFSPIFIITSPPFLIIVFVKIGFKIGSKDSPKKCIKKRRRSNVVEKFRKFSDSVWVSFEAMIIEKTLKED